MPIHCCRIAPRRSFYRNSVVLSVSARLVFPSPPPSRITIASLRAVPAGTKNFSGSPGRYTNSPRGPRGSRPGTSQVNTQALRRPEVGCCMPCNDLSYAGWMSKAAGGVAASEFAVVCVGSTRTLINLGSHGPRSPVFGRAGKHSGASTQRAVQCQF